MKPITGHVHGSPAHVKACMDAGNHDLARSTPSVWATLPLVGYMEGIELRNCACTSTLAIEVSE